MAKPRSKESDLQHTPVAELIQRTLDSWYPRSLPTKFERPGRRVNHEGKGEKVFTVGEVSQLVGIPPARIRSWEGRYRFPNPRRSPRNWRLYTSEDVEVLKQIRTTLLDRSRSRADVAAYRAGARG